MCLPVLQLLGQKRIPGAEVDSSARDPPPKCHPDTRKSLRGRITGWLSNVHRDWRMLWVIGPMGVGKSAIAQTIAEETKQAGQLGAALFFSRSNHKDDPDGVISTLAYQLAVKSPEYKQIITQCLINDPTILEKNRRTQFKELIIEPFQTLMTQRAQTVQTPLLIILDGLDECQSKEAQCEFIELISDHARHLDQFPLLWMICSRPEWHLKGLMSHPDFQVTCKREEMVIDDVEAEEDVNLVLKEGFRNIYHKYQDYLEPDWPSEADFRRISSSASGHFAFASTILKYVGDPQHANPRAQLQTCIRFLGRSETVGAMNPFHALDLLYRQVLSDVPKEILETTLRILNQIALCWQFPLTVLSQANFLCIDQPTFYRSLQYLHSVLVIPSARDAPRYGLRFHHTSFKEFLLSLYRSGPFAIDVAAVSYDMATLSLKWLNAPVDIMEEKHGEKICPSPELRLKFDYDEGVQSTKPVLEWVHPEVAEEKILAQLKYYSSRECWMACYFVDEVDLPKLAAQFEHFNFNRPQYFNRPYLITFFPWLFRLVCLYLDLDLKYTLSNYL